MSSSDSFTTVLLPGLACDAEIWHRAAGQNRAMMTAPDLRDALGALRCPTLVVCGDGDLVTPPECSREIAQGIAGARLELLADCGHMLTMEKPAALNALLGDWLAALAARGRPRGGRLRKPAGAAPGAGARTGCPR